MKYLAAVALLGLTSCKTIEGWLTPDDCVKASNVWPNLEIVLTDYDTYVEADSELTEAQRGSRLLSSEILRDIFEEATR